MSDGTCPICKENYERSTRKAFILLCGHSACSKCINFFKEAKKEIECGKCCKYTQSANIEIQDAYKTNSTKSNANAPQPGKDEFEIFVRKKDQSQRFSILVRKDMTLEQLTKKIKTQEGIEPTTYTLNFKKPLLDPKATLLSYDIKKTVTVTMTAPFVGGMSLKIYS